MTTDPREQFGREASKYLTSAVHADSEALAELVALVKPNGGTIVDVGTGAGHVAFAFAPSVERVIATDPTQAMLDVTAKEALNRGIHNLETRLAFAEALPFDDQSVQGVTCRVAAHHFDDVPRFLSEVVRCLEPGGWFLLVDTVSPEDQAANEALHEFESLRDPSHRRNLKVSEWTKRIEEAGMAILESRQREKRLRFVEWMDRMSVTEPSRTRLTTILKGAEGELRSYLKPGDDEFSLLELTVLAKRN